MLRLQAHSRDLSPFEYGHRAQQIFNDVVYELIRQIAVHCSERARLLATVWVRSSDTIGALSSMFTDEKRRHEAAESTLREELRQSRRDYLQVVERLELHVKQEHETQEDIIREAEEREARLEQEISALRDQLHDARAEILAIRDEQAKALLPKPRHIPDPNEFSLEAVLSEEQNLPLMSEDGRALEVVASLKAELQRERILLLDASVEIAKLKGVVPRQANAYAMTDPKDVADAGTEPMEDPAGDSEDDLQMSETTILSKTQHSKKKRKNERHSD
jgi:hypothetical protein